MTEIEEWKPVPISGYCENYEVSSFGNVRRRTDALRGPAKRGDVIAHRCQKYRYGHTQVSLCHNSQYIYPLVHRLVMLAFGPPAPSPGLMVCHNDGDPKNNRLSNLRWDDAKGNMADQTRHGTLRRGSQRNNAKLTEETVAEIRRMAAAGVKQRELAKRYGVSDIVVSFAVNRKTWKHVA
jgi:hypothetical protein